MSTPADKLPASSEDTSAFKEVVESEKFQAMAATSGRMPDVYSVAALVSSLLKSSGIKFRIGGSYVAKAEFGAERQPKDLDLEFWSYDDAVKASKVLADYKVESDVYPRVGYFLQIDDEQGVSVAMKVFAYLGPKGREPILTIELNNENAQQGGHNFMKAPQERHQEQPTRMRRNSLIASALERFSYTKALEEPDTKEDEKLLTLLVSSASQEELPTLAKDVKSMFKPVANIKRPAASKHADSDSESDDDERLYVDHEQRMKHAMAFLGELIKKRMERQ